MPTITEEITAHNGAIADHLEAAASSARYRRLLVSDTVAAILEFTRETQERALKEITRRCEELLAEVSDGVVRDATELSMLAETVRAGHRLVPMPKAATLPDAPAIAGRVNDPTFEAIVTSNDPDPDPAIRNAAAQFAPVTAAAA